MTLTSVIRHILCLFLLFFAGNKHVTAAALPSVDAFGQLLSQYEQAASPSSRVDAANRLFAEMSDFIGEEYHFNVSTAADTVAMNVYYWASEYYYDQQQYDQAKSYGLKALPLCEANGSSEMLGNCLNVLAITYIRMSDSQHAALYAKRCYELDLQSGDPDNISSSLNTLAGIYLGANLPQEAEQYVLKGIEYAGLAGNTARLAVLNGMASEVYHALSDQQKSYDYALAAYRMEQQLGRASQAAIRLSQMAAALTGLHRFSEAKSCLQKAIPQLETDGNLHSLGICCNKMGEILKWEEKYDSAAVYFGRGADIFQRLGDPYNEVHSQLGLYNSLKDSNPQEAMQHMERHNQLKDTIYTREAAQVMGRVSAEMDNLGAHQANAELQAQNEASRLRARKHLYIGIGVALIAVLLALFFALQLRRRTQEFTRQFNELSTDYEQLSHQFEQMKNAVQADDMTHNEKADAAIHRQLSAHDSEFLSKVDAIVNRQIEEGRVNVSALAEELCMSITAFRRRFSALVDEKPQAYVMRLRMEKARQLIVEHPELTIAEVGLRLGFDEKANFTRAFKRVFGAPPSEYKETEHVTQ